jgi:hypothetical protein
MFVIFYEDIETDKILFDSVFSKLSAAKNRLIEYHKDDCDFKIKYYQIQEFILDENFEYKAKDKVIILSKHFGEDYSFKEVDNNI